ncbi:MAG: hypothetical protein NTY09_05550 [bacterium]|nr:hypothetical protein [bacterium]
MQVDQATQPLYESRNIPKTRNLMLLIIMVSLGALEFYIFQVTGLPDWTKWAITILFVAMIIYMILFWPRVWLLVYPDHVLIKYGLLFLLRLKLNRQNVLSIEDASSWSYVDRTKWAKFKWRDLTNGLGSDADVLAIKTTKSTYLFECVNPQEALLAMAKVFGSGIVKIEPLSEADQEVTSERPWKPKSAQPFDPSSPLGECLYKFTNTNKVILYIFSAFILACIIIPMVRNEIVYPNLRFSLLHIILGIILPCALGIFVFREFVPIVRGFVYPGRIILLSGLIYPIKYVLPIEQIKAVKITMFDPVKDFSSPLGVAVGKNKWKGSYGFFGILNNKGISIEGDEGKIVIACEKPEELSLQLKTVLNGIEIDLINISPEQPDSPVN